MIDRPAALPVRVLIIEDDETLATMLMRALQRDRHFVTHAADGEAGVEAFKRERPHVVLIDGLLPRLNGFEVCKAIRDVAGDTVGLLLMSAAFRSLTMRSEAFRDSGADAFFPKPFVIGELRKRIVELADRSAAHKKRDARSPRDAQPPGEGSPAPVDTGPFDSSANVLTALMRTARAGASGILKLGSEGSILELAFLRGILVGARDNLRENQLGERLLRQGRITHATLKTVNERVARGERVAEALVAMGAIDAYEALTVIDDQVRERLARALTWRQGSLAFVPDEAAAGRMALEGYDLQRELLAWALDGGRDSVAAAFLFARGSEVVERTVDFEEGLATYAQLRPRSGLPASLLAGLAGSGTVDDVAARAGADARDLFALWTAGLVRFRSDADDPRPLPRPLVDEGSDLQVDREAASRVATALLRMRGRNHYEALELEDDASVAAIEIKLASLDSALGVRALGGAHLGPARQAARELWALLADIRVTLTNADARRSYDAVVAPRLARPTPPSISPEQSFLDGQMALARGDAHQARDAFELATNARPNDPDFNAWLAWASILDGEDERFALDILETAARAYPQAMRPEFFLGLAAQRRGELDQARIHLQEAVSRAPGDIEARGTLAALAPPGSTRGVG